MSAGTRTGAGMRRGTVRLLPVPGMNCQAQVVPQTIRSGYQIKAICNVCGNANWRRNEAGDCSFASCAWHELPGASCPADNKIGLSNKSYM